MCKPNPQGPTLGCEDDKYATKKLAKQVIHLGGSDGDDKYATKKP